MNTKSTKNNNILLTVLFMIPIITYFAYSFCYSVNMPNMDDYDVYYNLLKSINPSINLSNLIDALLTQHMEHRITFVRLIFLVQYLICGKLNFIILNFIGQLGLCLILMLILKIAHNYKISFKYLVPIPYVLFALSQNELINWSMASIQQYYQLFFSLLSIYTAINCKKQFNLQISFLYSFISTFTGGGGLLCYPVIALYYLVYGNIRKLILWLGLSAVTFILYFKILEFHSHYFSDWCRNEALRRINQLFIFILNFNGSYFLTNHFDELFYQEISGLVLLIFIAILFYRKLYNQFKDISLMMIYLIACSLVVSINRFNVSFVLASRYSVYPLVLICITYLVYIKSFNYNKKLFVLFNLFSIYLSVHWMVSCRKQLNQTKFALEHSLNYTLNDLAYSKIKESAKNKYLDIIPTVKNILPENIPLNDISLYKNGYLIKINSIKLETEKLSIEGQVICQNQQNSIKTMLLKLNDNYYPRNFGQGRIINSKFSFAISKSSLPELPFTANILVVDKANKALYLSKTIIIDKRYLVKKENLKKSTYP